MKQITIYIIKYKTPVLIVLAAILVLYSYDLFLLYSFKSYFKFTFWILLYAAFVFCKITPETELRRLPEIPKFEINKRYEEENLFLVRVSKEHFFIFEIEYIDSENNLNFINTYFSNAIWYRIESNSKYYISNQSGKILKQNNNLVAFLDSSSLICSLKIHRRLNVPKLLVNDLNFTSKFDDYDLCLEPNEFSQIRYNRQNYSGPFRIHMSDETKVEIENISIIISRFNHPETVSLSEEIYGLKS